MQVYDPPNPFIGYSKDIDPAIHYCSLPETAADTFYKALYPDGTIWMCLECRREWILINNQVGYLIDHNRVYLESHPDNSCAMYQKWILLTEWQDLVQIRAERAQYEKEKAELVARNRAKKPHWWSRVKNG